MDFMNKLFISHTNEESKIAIVIKEKIQIHFLGIIDVFVSSDYEGIPLGKLWIDEIKNALNNCDMMISIVSEESISRPWINLEFGFAISRNIPVVFICHGELIVSTLKKPYADYMSINLSDKKFLHKLFFDISKHYKIPKVPELNYVEEQNQVNSLINNDSDQEYWGLFDYIKSLEDSTIILTNILNEYSNKFSHLKHETENMHDLIISSTIIKSNEMINSLHKKIISVGKLIQSFSNTIQTQSSIFNKSIKNIEKSYSFIIEYNQNIDKELINDIITKFETLLNGIELQKIENKNIISTLRTLPKIEKHFNKSVLNYIDSLEILNNNISEYYEVILLYSSKFKNIK